MTRLPDAEIDDVIAADPSGLTPTSVAQDLALEVRERRAAEMVAPIGSDVEREMLEAATRAERKMRGHWEVVEDMERDGWKPEVIPHVEKASPANVLALLSELAQLRARVGELEGSVRESDLRIECLDRELNEAGDYDGG